MRPPVIATLAVLQFPLLFLPVWIVTLSIYGSEFELPSGRYMSGLMLWLPAQVALSRGLARRVAASPAAWSALCTLAALTVTWAYRPLHFGWWDERSVGHALGVVLTGVASLFLSSCAAERLMESRAPWIAGLPGGLLLCALPWYAAAEHPYFAFLGVALAAGTALASVPERTSQPPQADAPIAPVLPPSVLLWALSLATIDISLPVWERNLEGGFGPSIGAALASAALGAAAVRARGATALRWLLALGGLSYLATSLVPEWAVQPLHQVLPGAALGAALAGLDLRAGLLPLRGATLCIGLGWLAAIGLTQNLAFAGARALFVLAPIALWCRARPGGSLRP